MSKKDAPTEVLPVLAERNHAYERVKTHLLSPTRARHELTIQTAMGPYRVDVECEDAEAMHVMQTTTNEVVKNLGAPK